jgi:hypothetical protein
MKIISALITILILCIACSSTGSDRRLCGVVHCMIPFQESHQPVSLALHIAWFHARCDANPITLALAWSVPGMMAIL